MQNAAGEVLLVVIGQLDRGGTENHLAQVFPAIQSQTEMAIKFFVFRPDGELAPRLTSAGIEIISPSHNSRGWLGVLRTAKELFFLLRRMRPKIVHYYLPEAYLLGGVCAKLCAPDIQIMSRRGLNTYHAKRWYARPVESWLHRGLDLALGNSQAVARDLCEEGLAKDKVSLIYNGVDLKNETTASGHLNRAKFQIDEHAIVFVMVANLIPYKGHLDLLAAVAQVPEAHRAHWRFLIVGSGDDTFTEELHAQARALSIDGLISWMGSSDKVFELLTLADIGLLVSHEEGFSNAILEYMAASLPVIATSVGGNPEAVCDGETGLLIPSKDVRALAGALEQLAGSEKLRDDMGRAGRQRVEENFSQQHCIDRYLATYDNLLTSDQP